MFGFINQIIDLAVWDVSIVGFDFLPVPPVIAAIVCFCIGVHLGKKKRQFQQIFGLPADLPEQEVLGRRLAYVIRQRYVAAKDAETRVLRLQSELSKASVEDDNLAELKKQVAELHEAENTNDHLQEQYQSALDVAQRFNFEINAASDGVWVARHGLNLGIA